MPGLRVLGPRASCSLARNESRNYVHMHQEVYGESGSNPMGLILGRWAPGCGRPPPFLPCLASMPLILPPLFVIPRPQANTKPAAQGHEALANADVTSRWTQRRQQLGTEVLVVPRRHQCRWSKRLTDDERRTLALDRWRLMADATGVEYSGTCAKLASCKNQDELDRKSVV